MNGIFWWEKLAALHFDSGSVNGEGANEMWRVMSQVHQAKQKNSKWGNEQEEHTDNVYGSHVLGQVISYFGSSVVASWTKP